MSGCCKELIGNVPPSAGGAGDGGIPNVFFRATKTDSAQTISDSTATTLTFNNEDYDQGSWYVSSTANCPNEGLYLFETTVDVTFQSAGYCRIYIDVAGVGVVAEDRRIVDGAEQHVFNLTALVHLAQSRLVQIKMYQVTGNTASVATGITRFNGAQLLAGASS
jgi:hypothetical protein